MRTTTSRVVWAFVSVSLGCVLHINGQVLDLQTGRSADLSGESTWSVEGGVVLGDADYIGSRINWLVGDKTMLMGDIGLTDYGDDELSFGGNIMQQLTSGTRYPIAIKAGLHVIPDSDVDLMDASLLGIISTRFNEKIEGYANLGIHYVDRDSPPNPAGRGGKDDDDVLAAMGVGVVIDINPDFDAYAGLDVLLGDIYDDVVVGGGIRYGF